MNNIFAVATLILLVAKLTGFFPYSWLWVLAPMGVATVIFLVTLVLLLLAAVATK